MSQPNRVFRYILQLPSYTYPEDSVEAANKTEARKLIAQAYRADTPRDASRSGFVPFHKCKIVWVDGDEGVVSDAMEFDAGVDTLSECTQRFAPHPNIGELCRDGKQVFYTVINGNSDSGYFEGSYQEVLDKLNSVNQ